MLDFFAPARKGGGEGVDGFLNGNLSLYGNGYRGLRADVKCC